ncbi:acyl-ACP--UDP-N-acetylglucosamine O-acyltransferase [Spongiibacter sp. KMU-166]|uniref:Acyl-[acyl-carrier-protein]--UDP-N-acetylglucosamine O-acyltransferase n=1 Tax=Spongiibacter thalassae TaxID=2721624 RepID=A0ABX1GGD1_9GAMM|nr:acyl-ACP--UDP-N-acetylglucosamine O-acyltransferase [Spongiibacter thalassae]
MDPSAVIDPRAIIDPTAIIGANVKIGPWTLVGPEVELGEGCDIRSHVVLKGPTKIGARNTIYQFSTVGEDTPDLKYRGEPTQLIMGDNNIVREGVTIHRGTVQDQGKTVIGSNNLLMAYVHIGHDSVVGDNCILVNNASLAGHVVVGDWAILSGYSLVHQYCLIGAHSFAGFGCHISKDVPAYVTVSGSPAEAKTINVEGLKRRGFSGDAIAAIRRAYKIIYRQNNTVDEALAALAPIVADFPEVQLLVDSLKQSQRGIVR